MATQPRPTVLLRVLPRFPARVETDGLIGLTISNGVYTFALDEASVSAILPGLFPMTKGQLLGAVSDHLSGGLSGFQNWVDASPDSNDNIAFYHSSEASTLTPTLLAYIEAATTDTPPGIGLSTVPANSKLSELLTYAATYPR